MVAENIVMTFAEIECTYYQHYKMQKLDNFVTKTQLEIQHFKILTTFFYSHMSVFYISWLFQIWVYKCQHFFSTTMNLQKKLNLNIFVSHFNLVTFVFSTTLKPKFWPIWFILLKKGFILKKTLFFFQVFVKVFCFVLIFLKNSRWQ